MAETSRSPPAGQKPRNQTACDVCRARKIRCTYEPNQQRCRGCEFLDSECTHDRPRRKRGPPNKHAQRLQQPLVGSPAISSPANIAISPETHHSSTSPQSLHIPTPTASTGNWLSLFAPEPLISRLYGDWFNEIHPLAPIHLRRQFLRRLQQGEGDTNADFCGLVISLCAATKATLPRRDYGLVTVDYCVNFLDTHGLLQSQFGRDCYSIDRCIAMYHIGTAMSATTPSGLSSMRAYHALSEAAAGTRYLVYYRLHEYDEAQQQLLRRLMWLLFASACSADIFGRLPISLLSPERMDTFPKPLALSDNQLEPSAIEPAWHGDDMSYIPGLNSLSDLFLIWQDMQQTPKDTNPQTTITRYLVKVQKVLDDLPPELRWRGGLSRPATVTEGHDSQIANLFVTSLNIRSNILQKFGPTEDTPKEHGKIIDDLLEILYHLPSTVFHANGSSLVPKIRDIGAAYLEHGGVGDDAKINIARLLWKLEDLDCWQGIGVLGAPGSM
ncbi:uncharacterized protein B0J16DRAFT_281258 [Fusarium flagelliforme]|uniref:uncharacterized protein n=1 Tax=Fusarium flagelliforme TaxID=2675880 RepID=UPI001E8D6245|nr:uncharacterized protein B0J16DRAFT_281258 [Fusarium flagelliforme]KAH7191751.1 hypothetical protein B0J16DRAFT_281258 [Fusarium flagelliforme]